MKTNCLLPLYGIVKENLIQEAYEYKRCAECNKILSTDRFPHSLYCSPNCGAKFRKNRRVGVSNGVTLAVE